jgi:hypothetical protein
MLTGDHQFEFIGAAPAQWGGKKNNPFKGAHYGHVGICRGWINGGNAPVKITATYQ